MTGFEDIFFPRRETEAGLGPSPQSDGIIEWSARGKLLGAQTGDNRAPAHLVAEGEGDKQARGCQCLPSPPKWKGSQRRAPQTH